MVARKKRAAPKVAKKRGSTPTARFLIVGIGASAGGLEAFKQLLQPLPAKPGIAIVLIQHLDPTHRSLLGPALAQSSDMPIVEATDGQRVARDHVYVMPSNVTMTIEKGILKLSPRGASHKPNMPIDVFFRALAEDVGPRAVGVILSGTARDGTLGLDAIKANGGTTIVQSPETAKFDGMPRSAIDAGTADLVLDPPLIASELVALRRRLPKAGRPLAGARTEAALATLFVRLLRATHIDFSAYKRATILRRIARRLAVHKLERLDDYVAYIDAHPDELAVLHEDLLIHVTSFFRDPEAFEALETRILPEILEHKPAGSAIRIWVPACSTGEEVYSLAIAVSELVAKEKVQHSIQIFGSDVSASAIAHARAGCYPESALRELGGNRLRRFFRKQDGGYRIQQSIREMCVFVRHDVTSDPPFSKLDLISCRNVLIYFDAALQQRTVPLFHYALNDPGFLVLGRSETIASFGDLFSLVDKANKIYRRKPGPPRVGAAFVAGVLPLRIPPMIAPGASTARAPDLQRETEHVLLARYAPPGVVVNDAGDILHFRGHTGRYLEPAPGHANLSLFRMVREGLLLPLRDMLAKARRTGRRVRREGVLSRQDARTHTVNLEVLPLKASATQRCYLVLFEEPPTAPPARPSQGKRGERPAKGAEASLRRELSETKAFLHSLVEQQEATNDELTAANEELLSGNEELQSTNEEMNTAKEELQSTNEELTTVNDELQQRNRELSRLNDDLGNLLASVDIAIVILDRARKIRRFTPRSQFVMNLIQSDVGRPIGDINPTVDVPLLDHWITESLETLQVKEEEVRDREGRWYRLQIRPYRTSDDVIDGAVVSLVDIDALKRTASEALAARDFAAHVVETIPIPTLLLDATLNVTSVNEAFFAAFPVEPEKTLGRPVQELMQGGWLPAEMREPLNRALATRSPFELVEVEHAVPRVGQRALMITGRIIDGAAPGVLLVVQDVTDVKRAEENRSRVASLEHASHEKDLFLAMLSHELRTPLNSILLWSQVLRKDAALSEAMQRAAMGIEQSAKAQAQIVDDLLDVSRIVSGKLRITRTELDLRPLVSSTLETFHAEAEAKRVALAVTVDPTTPNVAGDAKRLRQVVWNLVSNALKFTPPSGHVAVRLLPANGCARIEVEDDGIGIDPAFLPRVFDRFAQQDSTTTRAHGGLGLGLALARHVVEAHGGTIRAENNLEGKGITLTVDLPASKVPRDVSESGAPAHARVDLRGVRILVVDDDSEGRDVVAHVLRERGAAVDVADSAQSARSMLEASRPDLIVCDVGMPAEDGVEFIRRLRGEPPERGGRTPAVALTAYADEENRRASLEAGFQLHVSKPIEIEELLSAVASLRQTSVP